MNCSVICKRKYVTVFERIYLGNWILCMLTSFEMWKYIDIMMNKNQQGAKLKKKRFWWRHLQCDMIDEKDLRSLNANDVYNDTTKDY